ncbi:hypothetical protein [Paenarthrobacter aurescens]|uniref:hypothetical protein n=1 Tax=Paenarthrobacter aurescens TaxID=43663 RepID=UPI0021BE13CE|nr:hypothetical protein [Paenarthrobacter aurescens]MCT9868642.1 hypothetical protein [Paenarthrobacter aurescens]
MKNPLVPGDATRPHAEPLLCRRCRSADRLHLETIESIEPHAGELMVWVSYTCQACEASYAHNAAFHDVAAILNRNGSMSGLLQFGGMYFHCGEPMTFAKSSARSVYAPLTTEDVDDGLLDVYLKTRVIQCRCGFRMELPA